MDPARVAEAGPGFQSSTRAAGVRGASSRSLDLRARAPGAILLQVNRRNLTLGLAGLCLLGALAGLAGLRRGARAQPSEGRAGALGAERAEAMLTATSPPQERVAVPAATAEAPASASPGAPAPGPSLAVTVLVRRDGEPVRGVEIRDGDPGAGLERSAVWASPGTAGLFDADPHAKRVVCTDGAGRAGFTDLAADTKAFWLREPGRERLRFVFDPERPEVRIEFGSAALEGHVYEDDGRPAQGVQLLALQRSTGEDASLWIAARTGWDGAYAIEGLVGGGEHTVFLWVSERLRGDPGPLALAPGERRRLDFGSPLGFARVTGTLRYPSGEQVESGQRLAFVGEETSSSWSLDEGGFEYRLPLGSYKVHLGTPDGQELGAFELAGEQHVELTMPGLVVRGPLLYVGTKHPKASGPEREVVLQLFDSEGLPTTQRPVRGERSYAFVGLAPGSYALATNPWPIAGTFDGRLAFELDGEVEEVLVALEITDP